MTATLLVEIAAKSTLVLLAGWGVTHLMGRASAASRHLVWVLTLAAALAVPAMHVAGPVWTLRVLPQPATPAAEPVVVALPEHRAGVPERILAAPSEATVAIDQPAEEMAMPAVSVAAGDADDAAPRSEMSWGRSSSASGSSALR
jgi:hypothetical protein